MYPAILLVVSVVAFSEASVYLYGPNPNSVSILSPYDYYYIRNLHKVQWAAPVETLPVTAAPFNPAVGTQFNPVVGTQFNPAVRTPFNPAVKTPFNPAVGTSFSPSAVAKAPSVAAEPQPASRQPYSFSYDIAAPDGRQSRQESADASGNVRGSYAFSLSDGRQRTVNYHAGADGFKATVDTNEQGTEQKNSADVVFSNSAPLPATQPKPSFPGAALAPAQLPKPVATPVAPLVPTPYGYDW